MRLGELSWRLEKDTDDGSMRNIWQALGGSKPNSKTRGIFMIENKNVRRRGITLNSPQDARRVIRRIVDRAFSESQELEAAGRISQLMSCWLKAYEMEKISDLESRLSAIESALELKK
jgi:hypothetical protein